ncbi:GNAT family N-acetyltransferase [Bacillus alkalicellulosilyticus]|uniref:GNAT family N-acetyltransferase n=1 Tax=Alkalihalobacterium alkalicellulosilyticum TaxID=1912214 RepID=UPI000996A8D3|nr:GNAT family protein [Bacillus alkalicellulosilyticus]
MKIEDIYSELPQLETERLILRKITMDDAESMFAYASKPEVTKFVTWDTHRTLLDTVDFIKFIESKYAKNEITPWGIELKETKTLIGTIDFVWWQPEHKVAEIGFALSPDYWKKGIMTEAASAVIRFGFTQMDLVRIQARCLTENLGSQKVLEKIGMTCEGVLRQSMFIKGKHCDIKLYSILTEKN